MQICIDRLENVSSISRKIGITVPVEVVQRYFQEGLLKVQREVHIKGFRPKQAPLPVVLQYHGKEVRHRVYHRLLDEAFEQAVQEKGLSVVGAPQVDQNDCGDHHQHDPELHEDRDFVFTATFEVMPEVQPQDYLGVKLSTQKEALTSDEIEKAMGLMCEYQSQLVPLNDPEHAVQMKDWVDVRFTVWRNQQEDLLISMAPGGASRWIPCFEKELQDALLGMKRGEKKNLHLTFPADYPRLKKFEGRGDLTGQQVEFKIEVLGIKTLKTPVLDDDFAKTSGYENLSEMRAKIEELLLSEKQRQYDSQLKAELFQFLIEKNSFDVPKALLNTQVRLLLENKVHFLQEKGYREDEISKEIQKDIPSLQKKAESQVRATLILQAIAQKESLTLSPEQTQKGMEDYAAKLGVSVDELTRYQAKNPDKKENFLFQLSQEATVEFLLAQSVVG